MGLIKSPALKERHMATSHPERAPSAADVEKALGGIDYPKVKEELVSHASQRASDKDLPDRVQSIPSGYPSLVRVLACILLFAIKKL